MVGNKTLNTLINQTQRQLTKAQEDKAKLQEEFHRLNLDESTPLFLAGKKEKKLARILENLKSVKQELETE